MGIFTFEEEHNSTLAPAKLYKTFVKDSHNIIPKVVEAIQSVEIVEGNGGPGTIKKITAVEGGKSSYVLHKVEAIDEANLVYNYSIVGGTELEDKLEKVSFETKVLPGPHGGSVLKITTKFYTKEVREATKFVKEVNIIQGDGEAGSIELVNFNEASPFKYLKQRSDVLDKDNLVCKYTTMAAGSSSVPYVVPYPGRYSAHLQQLYGGYPQPQSGFGYPSQPVFVYPPQPGFVYPPQPGLVAGSSSMPYAAPYPGGYSPQPQQLYGGYPQPQSGFGYPPQPGFMYPPQPGFVYAAPVQNLGTNNLFGKLGALAVGVLSEVIGNILNFEASYDHGA